MPEDGDTSKVSRSRLRAPIAVIALALLTVISGCSALGGEPDPAPGTGAGALEKAKIKVGLLPVVDVAPLYRAIDQGYFKAVGLEVEPVVAQSGPATIQGIIGGDLDIAFSSYPAAFVAQAKGAASLKIVADAYAARAGHLVLVATPNSPLKTPADAAGKKIAVAGRGSIADLGVMSVLKTKQVDISKIEWVQMGFPDMGPALARGDIDGAVVAEPFVTITAKQFGAMPVLDVSSGPTADISMSGWAAMEKSTSANPNTFAAFQRGLAKGVADVKKDRSALEGILVKNINIEVSTAQLVRIADYPESLDPVRLQRVADLMQNFAVIPSRLDVKLMLLNPTNPQ
jgi:NitT/TauT family transport system substrate-binding protein